MKWHHSTMRPAWIAFATGLLPIAGVAFSYWIAAAHGDVPACIPFIEGCTSISATGRHFPASLVFNATLLPTAALSVIFWLLGYHWLKVLGVSRPKGTLVIPVLGVTAGLFLIVYVSFLGTHSEVYGFLRRFGVTVYFGFTYLAQAFITRALWRLDQLSLRRPVWTLLALLILMLMAGLVSVCADLLRLDTNRVENIIEWNFGFLMMLFFIACGWAWRRSDFILDGAVR